MLGGDAGADSHNDGVYGVMWECSPGSAPHVLRDDLRPRHTAEHDIIKKLVRKVLKLQTRVTKLNCWRRSFEATRLECMGGDVKAIRRV